MENRKLKIALGSDLHLEFGTIELTNDKGADVLVLAGDICVAHHFVDGKPTYLQTLSKEYRKFFDQVCRDFPHVVYIMGNHEHYSGDVAHTYSILKEHLDYGNLHILEKETWTHMGHTFIGGTLWTDMNKGDSLAMNYAQQSMNDFREVLNSNRMVVRQVPIYEPNPLWTGDGKNGGYYNKDATGAMIRIGYKSKEEPARWTPEDSVVDHEKMLDYVDIVTKQPGSYIVVGHHCPSELSVAACYKGNLLNAAFRSSLDDFIEARPQIKLFFHGHTHHPFSYWIGETRVYCNPRGYIGHESIADSFQLKYITI
jgi:Icc-related predicted phosphoesterase